MKKQLTFLGVLLFLMAGALNAQVTQTNTQFPNPGFEKWTDHDCSVAQGTSEVPDNWHTFDEINCNLPWWTLGIGCDMAKKTSHFKLENSAAYGGSGNSLQLAAHNATSSVLANGTITSGRTRVKSTEVTEYTNYNYTDLSGTNNYGNGHYYWAFIGCPDSMSFYYKTSWSSNTSKPLIKVYLHKGSWYDHANGHVNDDGESSEHDITNSKLIAYCQTPFATSTEWTRFAGKFIQYANNSANIDNSYATITRPEYILASFSTNETAGAGNSSDRLSIDELWCIYDKGLASLTIGGTANTDGLNVFNAAEFLTHEPSRTYDDAGNPIFNNSGTATWTYPTPISCNNIPQISATPRSKLISQFTIMQAVPQNGYKATIYVKHNDNSEFYYYIQFTPALPNITLNNNGIYTACEGDDITVKASGASSYSWSDGLGSGATVHPTASGVYTVTGTANGCTSTATATVTVNQPTTGDTTATACESFDWYNHSNITESCSNLTHTLAGANINGCDSIVTLLLTINYGTHNAETESADESFTWHGTTYSTSGVYTYEYNNADGCASTDTLHLTINQGEQSPQTIALTEGFNWVSFNVEITLNDLKAALVEAVPGTSIVIKSKDQNLTYRNGRWLGGVPWDLSQMYIVQVAGDCEIVLEGAPVDPADHPVNILGNGLFTYIAFPFNESMSLTDAFDGFAVNNDVVKAKDGSSRYTRGSWRGAVTTLEPGQGYMYQSAEDAADRPFVFSSSR